MNVKELLKTLIHDRDALMQQIDVHENSIADCKEELREVQQAIYNIKQDYGIGEEDIKDD